jgi:predicted ATPase
VRIGLLGGLSVEHDGRIVAVSGAMQLAVLFRLAVDAGSAVSYRAISEDIWGRDTPENTKASLQSIVSRLRAQLPGAFIESTVGGYRLNIARTDVDALQFADLVAAARASAGRAGEKRSSGESAPLAGRALALWSGEPWIPSQNFGWFVRDLLKDHAEATALCASNPTAALAPPLPLQLTTLIGRESELATIVEQLRSNRLVTIIGTGGAGKTRLALETAAQRRNVMLVELAPVGPSEVLGAVLTATGRELRTGEASGDSSRARLLDALTGRDVLLVFDNCEHVIDAAAALAEDLLSALPLLRILATSREPLGVPGEAFVGLGSLPHPTDDEIGTMPSASLETFSAIELFCQRARSARGQSIETAELATVARICTRLDGLPLAIELAAAKLRTMTVDEVLTGLDDRFTLLTGGYRTARPRHQTLRAMIDWSWSLLNPDERRALSGFAVFPAGVGANEARSLAKALELPSSAVFDSLVDRSLLQRSRGRYRALETIREYGIERLAEDGTLATARTGQARYMMERATEFDRLLRGPRIMEAITWFDDEDDNLASALRYAAGVPLPEIAVRLSVACAWYWVLRDRNEDAWGWLNEAAGMAANVEGDEAKILSLVSPLLVRFAQSAGEEFDPAQMNEMLKTIVGPLGEIELGAGSHEMLQLLLPGLGAFAAVSADPGWFGSVRLPRGEELGLDPWPTAVLHIMGAAMAHNRGEVGELGTESEIALTLFREVGDVWGMAFSEQMRAEWLMLTGRLDEALALSDASTRKMREITSESDFAQQQGLSVRLLWRLGRRDEARARIEAMVASTEAGGDPRAILQAQISGLMLDVALGDTASAGSRISVIEGLIEVSRAPSQTVAMLETSKASLARQRGDILAAENHLRAASASALRSQDQPIIADVAFAAGMVALARGDVATAVRAADFATSMLGAYDPTHPDLLAIAAAADAAKIGRPSTEVPGRPSLLESLNELFAEIPLPIA